MLLDELGQIKGTRHELISNRYEIAVTWADTYNEAASHRYSRPSMA